MLAITWCLAYDLLIRAAIISTVYVCIVDEEYQEDLRKIAGNKRSEVRGYNGYKLCKKKEDFREIAENKGRKGEFIMTTNILCSELIGSCGCCGSWKFHTYWCHLFVHSFIVHSNTLPNQLILVPRTYSTVYGAGPLCDCTCDSTCDSTCDTRQPDISNTARLHIACCYPDTVPDRVHTWA